MREMNKLINFLSPFGFDIFCLRHKYLVFNLVGRNLKLRYRQSALGILWSLILPMLNAMIFYVVFEFVIKIKIPFFLVYILSGTLPWTFIAQTTLDGTDSLRINAGLISKIPLPLQIFPLVAAMTGFVNLLLATPVILATCLYSHTHLNATLLDLPFVLGLFFLLGYGLSLIVSIAVIYADDLRHLLTAVLQIWFYATPIVYDPAMIPAKFSWVIYLNPVGSLFVSLRSILISGQWPSAEHSLCATAWAFAILAIGMLFYTKKRNEIAEIL